MIAKFMICLVFAAAVVRADDWDLAEEDVYGEARLLDGVFNNTSIDLNSILALILIAVLALVTLGPNFLGGGGSGYGQRNSYYNYDYDQYYDPNQQFYQRSGRVDGKSQFLDNFIDYQCILGSIFVDFIFCVNFIDFESIDFVDFINFVNFVDFNNVVNIVDFIDLSISSILSI